MTTAFVLQGGASLAAPQVGMLRALLAAGGRPDFVVGVLRGRAQCRGLRAGPHERGDRKTLGHLEPGTSPDRLPDPAGSASSRDCRAAGTVWCRPDHSVMDRSRCLARRSGRRGRPGLRGGHRRRHCAGGSAHSRVAGGGIARQLCGPRCLPRRDHRRTSPGRRRNRCGRAGARRGAARRYHLLRPAAGRHPARRSGTGRVGGCIAACRAPGARPRLAGRSRRCTPTCTSCQRR